MSKLTHSRPRPLPWPIRGLAAGYNGVAAMTLSYYIERKLRSRSTKADLQPGAQFGAQILADGTLVRGLASDTGLDYDDSVVPGKIVASILHLPQIIGSHPGEITVALRWGYGSTYGLAHVFLRHRLTEPWASMAFGAVLISVTFSMFPVLGHTPPVWRWPKDVVLTALVTHSAYVLASSITDEVLR
jgi:hypothetical protein